MTEKNSIALTAAVKKISKTLASRGGRTSAEVPPYSCPPFPSGHNNLVCGKGDGYPSVQAHTTQVDSNSIHFCHADRVGIQQWRVSHTDLSVAIIVAPGNSGCYSSLTSYTEKSGWLPDNAVSLVVSDADLETTVVDPSTVASSTTHQPQ